MNKFKKLSRVTAVIFSICILFCGCGQAGEKPASETEVKTTVAFDMDLPDDQTTTFEIRTEDANAVSFDASANAYTITAAGEYDCYGDLFEGQLIVDAPEDADVVINLNGCLITCSAAAPVSILSADKAELSAKKDTENKICDLREISENEDPSGGAVYAECDLKLKGNGTLTVLSNYNNGVHTKDDLSIKNLTLTVMAYNSALRGNDSVSIESGDVTAISSAGDAVKTSSTDLDKKDEQRGAVTISGGTVTLYAACDGIDSASDVDISGDAVVNIYTDEYSSWSSDYIAADDSVLYLRLEQSLYEAGYQYAAYFFDENGKGQWSSAVFEGEAVPDMGGDRGGMGKDGFDHGGMGKDGFDPGGMGKDGLDSGGMGKDGFDSGGMGKDGLDSGGMGKDGFDPGGMEKGTEDDQRGNVRDIKMNGGAMGRGNKGNFAATTYYYYVVERPGSYTNVRFYAYDPAQTPGQDQDYTAATEEDTVIPQNWDTCILTAVSEKTLVTSGWTSYRSNSGKAVLDHSCKGIKAANAVTITGGTVTICAKDDGIHANFDEVLESTGKNGLGNVTITGGVIRISSDDDGIHADQDLTISGGTVTVDTSYEALEGNRIFVTDGKVTVSASDDAVNANSKGAYSALIEVSGGTVDATVPNGDTDTMDSNGTIQITGGFVFLKNGQMSGSSMGGGTLDSSRGVSVTGGTVIAVGCIGESVSDAVSDTVRVFEPGEYSIRDAGGNTVAGFSLETSYRAYIFCGDAFDSGQTYNVYCDGDKLFEFTK